MTVLRACATAAIASDGDLIIVQEKYNAVTSVQLKRGEYLNNRYGRFAHDDIIGQPLGRRWEAKSHPGVGAGTQQCAGFVHALSPTPELWSLAMLHRTQIVYPHDASIIALYLDLRPGCTLVEAGTGSGSASVAFARVVAPRGKVKSFEFHQPRAKEAQKDFDALDISSVVQVSGGVDVVKKGFVGIKDGEADAVFLDLPAPYLMGAEIARVLKPNGTVCTFSPCIEQVQRSVEMFRKGPFHSVRTVTAPVKTYETREQMLGTPGFSGLCLDHEVSAAESSEQDGPEKKKMRTDFESDASVGMTSIRRRSRTAGAERLAMANLGEGRHDGRVKRVATRLHSKPYSSMKGHTSYLTFARRRHGKLRNDPSNLARSQDQTPEENGDVSVKGDEAHESCTVS